MTCTDLLKIEENRNKQNNRLLRVLGVTVHRVLENTDLIEIDQAIFHKADLDCVYEEQVISYQIFENECSSVIMNRDSSEWGGGGGGRTLFCDV